MTIAVRYSAQRQQFGPPDAPEVSVLDYPSQQQRLMPMLATAYALHFTRTALVDRWVHAAAVGAGAGPASGAVW